MPFKFYNYWTSLDSFPTVVHDAWANPVDGNFQFQLFQKLKHLKGVLKKFARTSMGNVKIRAEKAREELMGCQKMLDIHPSNALLKDQEKNLLKNFLEAIRIEEEVLRQKSRVQWLDAGDRNTAFFHNSIKNRRNSKRIVSLLQPNGVSTQNEGETKAEALRYSQAIDCSDSCSC